MRAAIGAGHRAAAKRAEHRADRVLEELRRIAFADIRAVVSVTGGRLAVADTALWSRGRGYLVIAERQGEP